MPVQYTLPWSLEVTKERGHCITGVAHERSCEYVRGIFEFPGCDSLKQGGAGSGQADYRLTMTGPPGSGGPSFQSEGPMSDGPGFDCRAVILAHYSQAGCLPAFRGARSTLTLSGSVGSASSRERRL